MRTRVLTGALILGWLPQYLGLSLGWIFRGHERMDRDAVLNVVLKLATLLASIGCLALGGRLLGLVFAWWIAGCLTLALGIGINRRLRLPVISASLSTARELLRDGASFLAISLEMLLVSLRKPSPVPAPTGDGVGQISPARSASDPAQ